MESSLWMKWTSWNTSVCLLYAVMLMDMTTQRFMSVQVKINQSLSWFRQKNQWMKSILHWRSLISNIKSHLTATIFHMQDLWLEEFERKMILCLYNIQSNLLEGTARYGMTIFKSFIKDPALQEFILPTVKLTGKMKI